MFDAQSATRDRVDGRAVCRAVVGDHSLDGDAVAGEVGDCALEEADRSDRFFIGENLDVRQAGGVVDRDVNVLPANCLASDAGGVCLSGVVVLVAVDAMPSAALDPPEL